MTRVRIVVIGVVTLIGVLLIVPAATAQQASGIIGIVRDTSGAVLPGVTVEAASPALIEKVRTVFTDGEGRFSIVDLRPGAYIVTFTLPGFATVKREGIELGAGFTATVNADMRVGAVEETVTVTGAAPVVDTQTVRRQTTLSQTALDALPTGNTGYSTLVNVTAGFVRTGTAGADVGGTKQTWSAQGEYQRYHGKASTRASFDGMRNQHFSGTGGGSGAPVNADTVAEFQLETSGMGAENSSGTTALNAIPKEGSNIFAVMFNGKISTGGMQSANLDDELRARGLTTEQEVQKIYRGAGTFGGPIMKDRLWFFGAVARWGMRVRQGGAYFNKLQGTLFHEFDLSRPADNFDWNRTHAARFTWQATPRQKVAFFGDIQNNCNCTVNFNGANAIESYWGWDNWPSGIFQGTWSAPLTSRLLLEAGASYRLYTWVNTRIPGVTRDDPSILEASTNYRYGASGLYQRPIARTGGSSERFAVSYVTGSHTLKVGVTDDQGYNETSRERNGPDGVNYTFLRGVPIELDMYAVPFHHKEVMKAELGIYAQDAWTIKRLTLNMGLRYDYITFNVPAEDLPAGPFVPARKTEALYKVPEWKDWNPRFGASYDLFGTGRTALKFSLGKYMELPGSGLSELVHPLNASINSARRAWNDANKNYVPDCDLKNFTANGECGPINDTNFGSFNPNSTRFGKDILRDNRIATWDFVADVQHELVPGLSVSLSYNRNWDRNFRVTDNLAVTPADFDPYCVTAPADARLPGGGGYQLCGLYDVSEAKFGKVSNLLTADKNYGRRERVWDGLAVTVDGRFARGLRIGGGVDVGRQVEDICFVIDSPQELLNCRIVTPFRGTAQVKLNGSYLLPGDFQVGAVLQNLPGPEITASWAASNADIAPSLGRNLSGRRQTATTLNWYWGITGAPLIVPQTQFEKRFTQLDLRLTKIFTAGRYRMQANVDLFNALNSNSVLSLVTTYGPRWKRPVSILDARLLQFNGQLSF